MSKNKSGPAAASQATGDDATAAGRDWGSTLFLPKTEFPMRAGLPQSEPKHLERWAKIGLYDRLREAAKGRPKFILHDGPPYANGQIHIGHALNKILKDLVTRSQQMAGFDSNYVPGWDCHGLPIEWKIEEEYRAKGRNKDQVPAAEFRRQCREFATHWLNVQREEFKRLGVEGDWQNPYSTMDFKSEGTIANEIMKVAMAGILYRGSKPVMWSVVEKTALAEAEVEYHPYQSDMVWVKFRVDRSPRSGPSPLPPSAIVAGASVVIWTTTPWTIPGNRAITFNSKVAYGLYEVTSAPAGNWAKAGEKYILADKLAAEVMKAAKLEPANYRRLQDVPADILRGLTCAHPLRSGVSPTPNPSPQGGGESLRASGYTFPVPLLDGDHVTDDAGTGFVHTAPGHGREDFDIWMASGKMLAERGIETTIPFTVDGDGFYTNEAPGFEGRRVITDKGDKGDANEAVIKALQAAGMLIARGRLKHDYPHSWRSKKPVIFRNTPQWFIAMDKAFPSSPPPSWGRPGGGDSTTATIGVPPTHGPSPQGGGGKTLRQIALDAIAETEFVPKTGQNRLRGMIEAKPDWVLSRQRAWGVPITVFVHKETGEVIPGAGFAKSDRLMQRITAAISDRGADAWFEAGAAEKFLSGLVDKPAEWEQVTDILDVWFDSGCTHAFTLEDPQQFPGLAGIKRVIDGGGDRVMYLEGSDQHRGWFHSSLLESCATRGRAPYDVVLTHGFILDEKGDEKMSKSKGNALSPQDVMKTSGADILRLWVASADTTNDIRFGPAIVQAASESYRKIRNTMRWMLGTLAHYEPARTVARADMPELERYMLHRLAELDAIVRPAYAAYDYKKVVASLSHFMNTDLSAFYFDVRKDALYCEAPSSPKRRAALAAIEQIFRCVTVWLAPILVFTAEEAWSERYGRADGSVHLEQFPELPAAWRDDALAQRFETIRAVRSVITGALEIARAEKKIGASLEAAPVVHIGDKEIMRALDGIDMAELAITSGIEIVAGTPPADAFAMPDVAGVGVTFAKARGAKCARSWRITTDVGSDPAYPDLSARDAAAMREIEAGGAVATD